MSDYHFDNFFQRAITLLGIASQTELARILGVNRSAITQAKQRNHVPENWVFKLAQKFNLDINWLNSDATAAGKVNHTQPEFKQIPKVKAKLSAGGGSFEVDAQVKDYFSFRSDWLLRKGNPSQMVLMDVVGDSMEPLLEAGDTVLIDQSQKEIIAGKIYAVGVEDTVMVKRIEKHPGRLVLISSNPQYYPLYLQEDELESICIIGTLIWSCRELA